MFIPHSLGLRRVFFYYFLYFKLTKNCFDFSFHFFVYGNLILAVTLLYYLYAKRLYTFPTSSSRQSPQNSIFILIPVSQHVIYRDVCCVLVRDSGSCARISNTLEEKRTKQTSQVYWTGEWESLRDRKNPYNKATMEVKLLSHMN